MQQPPRLAPAPVPLKYGQLDCAHAFDLIQTDGWNRRSIWGAAVLAKALGRTGRPAYAVLWSRTSVAIRKSRCTGTVRGCVSFCVSSACIPLRGVARRCERSILHSPHKHSDFALVRFGALRCGVLGRPFQGGALPMSYPGSNTVLTF